MVHDARRSRQLILAAAVLVAGCGGGNSSPIEWVGKPALVKPKELPRDRILVGRIKNRTGHELKLVAADGRIVDARGRVLRSTIRFAAAYGHGLYSYDQQPKEGDPKFEQVRLGEMAIVPAGKTAPLTLSWRLAHGTGAAARVVIGRIVLELPKTP